jgi:hypothetical protein
VNKLAGCSPVCSPAPSLENTGSTLSSTPAGKPAWCRRLTTAFRSPATTASFKATVAGSMFPAYRVGATLNLSRNPFGFSLLLPGRLRPGRAQCSKPVVPFRPSASGLTLTSAPLPGLPPVRLDASTN